MGNLSFYAGTMSSGKTTHLLQSHFNIEAAFPGQSLLFNRNDRSGESICTNRTGGMAMSLGVDYETNLIDLVSTEEKNNGSTILFIFLDEVQFFTEEHIEQLAYLADVNNIDVSAYGLLTSFKGELFSASKKLMELADNFIQVNNGARCWCGKRGTHNGLSIDSICNSASTDQDLYKSTEADYSVMCRKHFTQHLNAR